MFEWSKVRFNAYELGIRDSKCGRAVIVKLNPPSGSTTWNAYVPVLDGQFLPRYFRLADAKKAIENAEDGLPLPKVGAPNHQLSYENVGVPDTEAQRKYQETVDAFRARARYGTSTPPAPVDSPFSILGLPENATLDECKSAYRALALEHHPDHGGDPEKFKEVAAAWEQLKA